MSNGWKYSTADGSIKTVGQTGATGPTGPTGPMGFDGVDGIDGVMGATGPANSRVLQFKVVADDVVIATGDGKLIFLIDSSLNGLVLTGAHAYVTTVSSSGLPTVQIHNITDAVDILSTPITVDVSEFSSYGAATPPVINTSNDDVATGDRIRIDVDVAGTGAKGLGVILTFA